MRGATLLVAVLSVGCLDSIGPFDPKIGKPIAQRCVNEDTDPKQDVSFSQQILPMFRGDAPSVGCGCHLPGSANPIGIEIGGLDLSTFSTIRAGGVNSGAQIIIASEPCNSILWQKVTAGPPFGARMPFDGPPFLTEEQRRLIADWIAEGAIEN